VLAIGEILKLVIVERLFKLCRRKLLKIPLFAWGYGHWRQGVDWIVSMRAWQAARRWILKVRLFLQFPHPIEEILQVSTSFLRNLVESHHVKKAIPNGPP
jgi:hypothetical protein